jgi:hypothetical protein
MTRQPNLNEQQYAEELDRQITLLQLGKQISQQGESKQLVQQLHQVASTLQPRQTFTKELRSQLVAQAQQKSQQKKGVTRTSLFEEWVKSIQMKRLIFSLAGLTAVLALAILGWNILRPSSSSSEPVVEVAAIEVTEGSPAIESTAVKPTSTSATVETPTASKDEVVTQPVAPVSTESPVTEDAAAAFSGPRGQGGGGGYAYGEGQGPFFDTTFTLNADLPQDTEAAVYTGNIKNHTSLDRDLVSAFADKMGVNGELYFEWYSGLPVDGQDDGSGNIPYVYRIFDGKRQVSAYLSGEIFYEDTALYNQNLPPMPYAERAAFAEQFLLERNLLDFDYEIHSGWGTEIQFLPLVDGRPINNWAVITVNVTGDSQIMSVSIRPLEELTQIQVDPLRSAADAWQYVIDNAASGYVMFNLIPSNQDYFAPQPAGEKTHWEREFTSGQEVSLASWIQIFRPANGSVTPRLQTDRGLVLAADDATLDAIAEVATNGNNVLLRGTLSGEPNSLILNVSAWEAVTTPFDLYLNGTTRQINGVVSLELPGGFPIQIANPPADLPLDTAVSMWSWGVRVADDGVSAIADWVTFDLLYYNYIDQGVPFEDPFSNISGVTINSVKLVFQYLYPYESFNPYSGVPFIADDNGHLAPAWRFSGETNKGDMIEFIVAASVSVELPTTPPK